MNEPELFHYKIITTLLQYSNSEEVIAELRKLVTGRHKYITQSLMANPIGNEFYIENHLLYLHELGDYNEIKSTYLRCKIPAEYYSAKVTHILISVVGSTRRAEGLFINNICNSKALD